MRRIPGGRPMMVVAAAAALMAFASACGGGQSTNNAQPTPVFASGTATPGFQPGGAAADTMPGMPGMSMSPPAQAAAPAGPNAVNIDNFAFAPATLTVKAGTKVTWANRDEEPHTVAATDGSFHSPGLGTGATYSFTFAKAGTFAYICSIHPFMKATVVVTP
ncbi:cupredoxin family copper-binding protein [Nocardia sp. NBC_01499]|uniref:cupredoxin domain-containing protein n=1 Tax=Nocardia sp. NBC_01499 TaxID=2903597 RepID=UPI00386D7934